MKIVKPINELYSKIKSLIAEEKCSEALAEATHFLEVANSVIDDISDLNNKPKSQPSLYYANLINFKLDLLSKIAEVESYVSSRQALDNKKRLKKQVIEGLVETAPMDRSITEFLTLINTSRQLSQNIKVSRDI